MLLYKARCSFIDYSLVSKQVLGLGVKGILEEFEWAHCKCLESRLGQLSLVMASVTKGLVGKGMG